VSDTSKLVSLGETYLGWKIFHIELAWTVVGIVLIFSLVSGISGAYSYRSAQAAERRKERCRQLEYDEHWRKINERFPFRREVDEPSSRGEE